MRTIVRALAPVRHARSIVQHRGVGLFGYLLKTMEADPDYGSADTSAGTWRQLGGVLAWASMPIPVDSERTSGFTIGYRMRVPSRTPFPLRCPCGRRSPHEQWHRPGDCCAIPSGQPLRLRRIALTFMAITVAACVVAAALLLSRAAEERRAIGSRALEAAKALSFGFDQEVAAVNYLLKGTVRNPRRSSRATSRPSTTSSRRRRFRRDPGWFLNDPRTAGRQHPAPVRVAAATARGLSELPGANGSDPDRRWAVSGRCWLP
jgi:hypothetical protein